jgi:hypothetical protein
MPLNGSLSASPSLNAVSSLGWPARLVIVLILPLLFVARGAAADDHLVCQEGFLQIVSPDNLSMEQCRAVAKQTMAAWRFNLDQMHWTDAADMETPLTLRLISRERMKREHPGLLGFARGRDLLVVSTAVLDDAFANGTLAHELAHIQAKRTLGRFSEKHLVPRYFVEGHGLSLGRSYREYLRVSKHGYDVYRARQISNLSANEARMILTDNSYAAKDRRREDKMESMGVYFVEYLRFRYHRNGIPDAIPRIGHVFELVGRGKTYETAFKEQFGGSIDDTVAEIVDLFKRTEGNPTERLRGTRYQEFL